MTNANAPCVLVVEDDVLILMHACDILSDAGFHALEASNSDDAKAIVDDNGDGITLLFTDVEMPGSMNGYELARYVAERWPEIEIVVASGRMTPGPGDIPEKAAFIGKPFSADVIHDHLRATLPDGKLPDRLKGEK